MPWIISNRKLVYIDDQFIFATADDALQHLVRFALSPVAYAILMTAPPAFRSGHTVTLTILAGLSGYHISHVHAGMQELVECGFAIKQPYGKTGTRNHYAGVPTMCQSSPIQALRATYKRAA